MRFRVNNVNFDIANYVLPTHKLQFGTKRRVVLIADLHGYHNNEKKRNAIIEAIRAQHPHHIVIAGDHMNAASGRWHNNVVYGNLCKLVYELSLIAPVVLSQGNHDINAIGAMQEEANQRFMDLAKLNPDRIFPLMNGTKVIDEFEIVAITPSHEALSDTQTQQHGLAHDQYMEEVEKSFVQITGGDDVIVERAGHNPHLMIASENGKDLGKFKAIDSSLEGHIHNGYRKSKKTRENPDKYLDSHGFTERPIGLKDRNGKLIPSSLRLMFGGVDGCRGVIYVDDMSQRRYLQLRNGHFYRNECTEPNKVKWVRTDREEAIRAILDDNCKQHAIVISGGVKKFSPIPRIDEPEITVVDYEGARRK